MADDWNQRVIDSFRAHEGYVEGFGRRLVLLHHRGARSGTMRISPVMTFAADDGGWLVAASKGGAPENPAWFHNLKAHPDIVIEVPGEGEVAVHVEELTGEARDAAWARFAAHQGFASYQERTARTIPVLHLTRR
ncbi:nitroreductase family deazaflavin-dependent oxidoreductase [Demequina mangrovi]|uniref:Deazaflavin-dependent oxidoreductase, nitroreductase family n=1 Tax=Demequina mangrovi TaxID=1043493 RepID=A0A1H6Y222_9MICO|nr:nitroreductase family deazaflavin-dependent oxidoreductase [Demequina mangrovi]SEJ35368.1 deazaflavin-dependent oxidoreductase, nitroreductase family [Demequina mangrovi]